MVGDLKLLNSGKVREIYELTEKLLLIVTSDRISAFDVIMDQHIPEKGKDIVMDFLNDKFGKKRNSLYQSDTRTGILDNQQKKTPLKNLLLSKSLIVKF